MHLEVAIYDMNDEINMSLPGASLSAVVQAVVCECAVERYRLYRIHTRTARRPHRSWARAGWGLGGRRASRVCSRSTSLHSGARYPHPSYTL
jgi:hypothetical protein